MRNKGVDVCRGEIISFLDSDDALHKDMLIKMSEAMQNIGAGCERMYSNESIDAKIFIRSRQLRRRY